jgi:hypothetical protein
MTTWRPARQRLAAIAVLTAAITGAAAAALGATGIFGAGAYVVIAVAALFSPAAIVVQVIYGQLLAGSVLLAQDGPAPLLLLPVVVSVVVTAELLALVGRLGTPKGRDPGGDDLHRVGVAAVIGGVVFGAVVLVRGLPGPTGLVAIGVASAALFALAILLVGNARHSARS